MSQFPNFNNRSAGAVSIQFCLPVRIGYDLPQIDRIHESRKIFTFKLERKRENKNTSDETKRKRNE